MNRYHEHDGRWWFAVKLLEANYDPPELYNDPALLIGHHQCVPLKSVEITDALACSRSRAELGPVYVRHEDSGDKFPPEQLWGVRDGVVIADRDIDEVELPTSPPEEFCLATPDEMKAAGLWDD